MTINRNLNSKDSVLNVPFQCLKVEFYNLLIVIELFVKMPIKIIRNETIVDESISDCEVIVLKESSRLLVTSEHELKHLLVLNIHHHIYCEIFGISQLTKREITNRLHHLLNN